MPTHSKGRDTSDFAFKICLIVDKSCCCPLALMHMYVQMCWADLGSTEELERVLKAQQDAVAQLQAQVGDAGLSQGPSLTPRGCDCHLNLLSDYLICVACTPLSCQLGNAPIPVPQPGYMQASAH
jgi:hypothetical protein